MKPIRVYCERGAYRKELGKLENIALFGFPYEGKFKKVAQPVSSEILASSNLPASSSIRISDACGSDKLSAIQLIVGRSNYFDSVHIDSAYKAGCKIFLSRDKKDIINNRAKLEELLGMKFLHPDKDWDEFMEVTKRSDA